MDALTLKLLEHTGHGAVARHHWYLASRQSQWWLQGAPPEPRSTTNVFFGVHPLAAPGAAHQRTKNDTVAAVNCLFAEWDDKDFGGDPRATLAHVEQLRLPPTVAVRSGGGIHGYWLLVEPVIVTDDNRERLRTLQRDWVPLVGGDPAAGDLARVLRLPGTFNGKYDPPRRVEFIWYDEGDNFHLGALDQHVARWAPPAPVHSLPVVSARKHTGPVDDDLARVYAETALDNELSELALTPPGGRNDRLNKAALSLGQLVSGRLLTQHEVISGLYQTALAIGLTENETKKTIRSGYEAGLKQPRGLPHG